MPPDLAFYGSCTLDQDGCTTCGDVAVPVRVVQIEGCEALVEDRQGQQAWVATDFFPDLKPGDGLLVHLGVAIAKLPSPREDGGGPR
ncbi:MAG: HypC/HybG/HupF family hydrogenase formation chaperone [Meiothermus sp.]|nr:HypC/HybG/HupF family hydrogenase formation chaperone [Meiothermus sp.]